MLRQSGSERRSHRTTGVPPNNKREGGSGPCLLWGGLDRSRHIVPHRLVSQSAMINVSFQVKFRIWNLFSVIILVHCNSHLKHHFTSQVLNVLWFTNEPTLILITQDNFWKPLVSAINILYQKCMSAFIPALCHSLVYGHMVHIVNFIRLKMVYTSW